MEEDKKEILGQLDTGACNWIEKRNGGQCWDSQSTVLYNKRPEEKMSDKRAGKEVIFKPLRARDRSQGWTVNHLLLPWGSFCKHWMHVKWLIIVPFLSPIILTCSTGICGLVQLSRLKVSPKFLDGILSCETRISVHSGSFTQD